VLEITLSGALVEAGEVDSTGAMVESATMC